MAKRRRVAHPQQRSTRRRETPRRPWWAALIALIAVCGVAVWLGSQAIGGGSQAAVPPTPASAVAYPTPEPAAMIAAAERRPLPSTAGRPIAISDYLGRPVVLAFYAAST